MDALLHRRLKEGNRHRHHYRPRGRRVRHGQQAAVVRALTAARLRAEGAAPSFSAAAIMCGSCPQYVEAALVLTNSGDAELLRDVLSGHIGLLEAARRVKPVARLIAAYREATVADRVAFARAIGPTVVFDDALVPAI